MSTDEDQAREIAERIARRVSGSASSQSSGRYGPKSEVSSEFAAVRAGINDLQRKLAQLEARSFQSYRNVTAVINSMISIDLNWPRSAPGNSLALAGRNQHFLFPSK